MKFHSVLITTIISAAMMGAGSATYAKGPEQQEPPPPMQQQQQKPPPMQQQAPAKPDAKKPPAQKPKAQYIRVHRGDTLSRIARKHHTTVRQLKRLNRLRGDVIYVGQRLRVR